MSNNNNSICAICGFALGHHRHGDNACPTQIDPHLYNYRQTKFEFIIPDQSGTMKMKGPDLQQIPKEDALGKVARATVDKVNSLFKIITDNDRQRIRQYALSQFPDMDDVSHCSRNYGCVIGAEYATIYEREKQQELRNKVIDEIIQGITHIEMPYYMEPRLTRYLNSLKTK